MRFASLFLVALLAGRACAAPSAGAAGSVEAGDDATDISLADRLKTGLRARRPEETEFVEHVARLVDTGKLPRKLVDSTYIWAIRRRSDYPLPAFQRALHLQAERLGVPLGGPADR